jgi:ankyrin repeat protein
VEWCSKDLVELLVANGADVNAKDKFGRTPLQRCGAESQDKDRTEEMRKFLRDHGAKE